MRFHRALLCAATSALAGCSDPAAPTHSDVEEGYQAWTSLDATSYNFEVSVESSWVRPSGFVRVYVRDGAVVGAIDANNIIEPGFTLTIAEIWDHILAAHEQNELHSARFSSRGVPLEANMGPWALDGGVRYRIREFDTDD